MFTGIISDVGKVASVLQEGGGIRFAVESPETARELHLGDSVSINGACQTVVDVAEGRFVMQAVEETLKKTTLEGLTTGSSVNLELPVRLGDRLGGHIVQGHVDCVGVIAEVRKIKSSWLLRVTFPDQYARYVILHGSVAIDGISLTVAAVGKGDCTVSIIPHTLEKTTLSRSQVGMRVNMEFDVVGKYVESLLAWGKPGSPASVLSREKMREWGYDL